MYTSKRLYAKQASEFLDSTEEKSKNRTFFKDMKVNGWVKDNLWGRSVDTVQKYENNVYESQVLTLGWTCTKPIVIFFMYLHISSDFWCTMIVVIK